MTSGPVTLDAQQLRARVGDHPFVRWEIAPDLLREAWAWGEATAFLRQRHFNRRIGMNVLGPLGDVDRLLGLLAQRGLPSEVSSLSVERGALAAAERHFDLLPGGDWDWMWTTTLPPVLPGEALLVPLNDSADARDILALNEIGNPTAESRPGEGVTEAWVGVREDGRLLGAAAMHRTGAGAPHLVGIVVHPDARGRGLGAAMTASLTRRAVESDGVCTLGMYAHNDVARRLYHGLGYTTAVEWASRSLSPKRQ
ncbi:GNAT family N-acetyltransferase [Calidifontibacter sp. DB0510]|uniref:GNAT family N-acetyltransferase n=1 Tax=Metallococcus carri TaxID=1656884 RepID=A0A967EGG5_9MICO|nr:GNAT family N-acetyltransferase [Metallococcus carri]NHN55038.1 GNAT family N-acetyltransferase [Metallococcus carri]NOP37384.1 GNAT family N-acetyltransferase [Calidifontibacter sp. DB2511S]